ncbi:hypothetical protein TELCIR_00092, partial [Teladorsagia circumcincta]
MKKIVKSEKPRAAENYTFSPLGRSQLSSSLSSLNTSDDGTAIGRGQSSMSSQSTDATEHGHVTASSVHTSKATRNSQTLIVHKGSRYLIHRKKNHTSTTAQFSTLLNVDSDRASGSNETFVIQHRPKRIEFFGTGEV